MDNDPESIRARCPSTGKPHYFQAWQDDRANGFKCLHCEKIWEWVPLETGPELYSQWDLMEIVGR